MATPSKNILIASALGLAGLAFAGGFAASSATASPAPAAPIVDVHAWEEQAPAMPVELANTVSAEKCNPWDVSEVVMEEILLEMQRRGWRPPRQGDAAASYASFGVEGIDAVDPYAPMPRPGMSYRPSSDTSSSIAVLNEEDAERVRNEEVSIDEILAEQVPIPAPS